MAAGKPQLLQQFVLSAFLLCLCYSANGVQCFKEKKLLKLQQFRWRRHGRHAQTTITACLSHKSSKQTLLYHCFTLFCIVLYFALLDYGLFSRVPEYPILWMLEPLDPWLKI
ncbi:hypothetical protein ACFXTO_047760 [Malus domestica]